MRKGVLAAMVAVSVGWAGVAGAQDDNRRDDNRRGEAGAAPDTNRRDDNERGIWSATDVNANPNPSQMRVTVNGGLLGFTGDLGDLTAAGPSWGVSASAYRWGIIGGEISYEGARNPIDRGAAQNAGVADGAAMFQHGVIGMAKVGVPVTQMVRPFVGAGLGVTYANPNNEAEGTYGSDFYQQIPFAAGVEVSSGPLTAGLRADYRVLVNEEFADPLVAGTAQGGILSTTLSVGGRF